MTINVSYTAEPQTAEEQFELGENYVEGNGVEKDYKQAEKWYSLAAKKNHIEAQYKLGFLYENGLGVKKDLEQAKKWYDLAASEDNQDAIESLEKLQNKKP